MELHNKHPFYFSRIVWHITINTTVALEEFGNSELTKKESQCWAMEGKKQINEV